MTHSPQLREIVPDRTVNGLRRLTGVVWAVGATALAFVVGGSPLIAFDGPLRLIMTIAVGLCAVVMTVRAIVPQLPVWRGWTLQFLGGSAVASFVMSLFTAPDLGGYTVSRLGWSLLLLTFAAVAYLHWIGERVFLR
jgi:hypothetical protein